LKASCAYSQHWLMCLVTFPTGVGVESLLNGDRELIIQLHSPQAWGLKVFSMEIENS
jgi:hypothetical protein